MKTKTNWNGLSIEISAEPNRLLSRIQGEEVTSLKVTSRAIAMPLMNEAFAASLIVQAGGAANFVDVMLSAERAA
ncbi:MAG: hypothetical protein PSY14_15880 [bacterium]|nr:hypothetical protein [bacterium]